MTRVPFLDLSRRVASIRVELDQAIAGVLNEGRFVGGDPVARFEREFAEWCGAGHAVGVASGTDAITLALRAVGVGEGDEVITVANTCVPTVAGIEASGATPVLVDALAESMTIDPELVAGAVGPRTRAIVPVHLYGRCADMSSIMRIALDHDLKVVEDCAQAHGASHDGQRAGTMGDASAFSFYPTKNLGALGDGGAVTTGDPKLAETVRELRSYGERSQYDSIRKGTNSRLDTLQAAALSTGLKHLDRWTARRREIAATYNAAFSGFELEAVPGSAVSEHAYHLFVLQVVERDRFRGRLSDIGIETLVHYPKAVHQHEAYRDNPRVGNLSVSERLSGRVVSLPLYPELRHDEVERVIAAVCGAIAMN